VYAPIVLRMVQKGHKGQNGPCRLNGAGNISIGGHILECNGLTWFNPDTFAREHMASAGCDQETATGCAWQEGMRRLEGAVTKNVNYTFETTLGSQSGKKIWRLAERTTS